MNKLRYYLTYVEEFSGYDCDGHWVPNIVAATSEEEASQLIESDLYLGDNEYTPPREFELPSLGKRRKPFFIIRSGVLPLWES